MGGGNGDREQCLELAVLRPATLPAHRTPALRRYRLASPPNSTFQRERGGTRTPPPVAGAPPSPRSLPARLVRCREDCHITIQNISYVYLYIFKCQVELGAAGLGSGLAGLRFISLAFEFGAGRWGQRSANPLGLSAFLEARLPLLNVIMYLSVEE